MNRYLNFASLQATCSAFRAAVRKILASLVVVTVATPALAWDGFNGGTITAMDVTGGTNFGVRVYLKDVSQMCTGAAASWAYINETDSNDRVYVAALLMAQAQGRRVLLYTNLENGYCKIGYMSVTSN